MENGIRKKIIKRQEEKMKNFRMPTKIGGLDEGKNNILEFKSSEDLVWHEIIISELNKPIDKDVCRCGAIGCKYKNQLLHR